MELELTSYLPPLLPTIFFLIYVLFDVDYLIMAIYYGLKSHREKRTEPLVPIVHTTSLNGFVTPKMLDFHLHVNNAQYLRCCDFARFHWMIRTGVLGALRRLNSQVVVAASLVRYRKALNPFERYRLDTRLVGYDLKAIYLEQRFIRRSDQLVSTIVYVKYSFLRTDSNKLLAQMADCSGASVERIGHLGDPANFPPSLKLWIDSLQMSSNELKSKDQLS